MKEVSLQLKNNVLYPFSQEDKDRLREFKDNQILRARLTGAKKPRSLIQLNLYWALCSIVASNLEGMSKEDVDFEVKLKLKHIQAFRVVKGVTYVELGSIAFRNLDHIESCGFFNRAWPVMAKMISVSEDELLSIAKGEN